MKCAVLVPTRDRPALLKRALQTFSNAAKSAHFDIATIVVADDGTSPSNTENVIQAVQLSAPMLRVEHLPPAPHFAHAAGPGHTRTRGLQHIAQSGIQHDSILMFDDDVSFCGCLYQGESVLSAGIALLADVIQHSMGVNTISGCEYTGRQDLSLLEHISLLASKGPIHKATASIKRNDVPHVAPHGISGAFLFVPAPATELPPFLRWYNEDYFWLRRMKRDGWHLRCSGHALAHAPEDGLHVSFETLLFEQYGEALWSASENATAFDYDPEMRRLALDSLQECVEDLRIAADAVNNRGTAELRSYFLPILRRTHFAIHSLLNDVEANQTSAFLDDLRQVIRYCCA